MYEARQKLTQHYGEDFNYYSNTELRAQWHPSSDSADDQESGPLASAPASLPARYDEARFWVIGAGVDGKLWDAFKDEHFVGVGFKDF